MPRPVDKGHKHERTRAIIIAALDVFQAKGYAATRLDDIAAATGLTKPALYFYFESKEALFRATVEAVAHNHLPEAEALLEAGFATAEARLDAIIDLLYKSMTPDRVKTLVRMAIECSELFPDMEKFLRQEVFGKLDQVLLAAIRGGVESGEFRATALSDYTELTIGPALSLAMRQGLLGGVSTPDSVDIEAYKLAHFEMLLNHLKPGL